MKTIYILEIWNEFDNPKLINRIAAFESREVLEKYKLLNPSKKHLHEYYREYAINFINQI